MALTRDFRTLARPQAGPKFRNTLLQEGIETMLDGNLDMSKAVLRDYSRATVGFKQIGAETRSSPKSLIRMFGPTGNSEARNLFSVINYLQLNAGLTLHVTARRL